MRCPPPSVPINMAHWNWQLPCPPCFCPHYLRLTALGRVITTVRGAVGELPARREAARAGLPLRWKRREGSFRRVPLDLPAGARAMTCFVQWARHFSIARLRFHAWARVRGRQWQFGHHLDGYGGRRLLPALTLLIGTGKYRAHRAFARVSCDCPR